MTAALDNLFASAMQLPDESRLDLLELLILTIHGDPSLEAGQLSEVTQRIDDVRSGRVQTIPGGQVFCEIEQSLAARRKA